jgi:hypothetical protein
VELHDLQGTLEGLLREGCGLCLEDWRDRNRRDLGRAVGQSCLDGRNAAVSKMHIIQDGYGNLQQRYIPDLGGDDMSMPFRAHVSCNTRPKARMFFNIPDPMQSISSFVEIFG